MQPSGRGLMRPKRDVEHFAGCLLGGAVGDALGAPVEFLSLTEIRAKYGPQGIRDMVLAGGKARITDDTQMTMFTAEGIVRGICRGIRKGICNPVVVIHHAYLRWLHTQGRKEVRPFAWGSPDDPDDGWLIHLPELHAVRAPGNTCLDALETGDMGTIKEPINTSKGCGGVMRVAPIGLYAPPDGAFEMACEVAAITHGHPAGYLAAGTFAMIISHIVEGRDLRDAVVGAMGRLQRQEHWRDCYEPLEKAMELASASDPSPETVETLGKGFVAEEALAIAVYCSLAAEDDFGEAVRLAVNHGGDSDSTGSMTGNLLGAWLGREAIPYQWLDNLELAREIEHLADDMLLEHRDTQAWWERYPGW